MLTPSHSSSVGTISSSSTPTSVTSTSLVLLACGGRKVRSHSVPAGFTALAHRSTVDIAYTHGVFCLEASEGSQGEGAGGQRVQTSFNREVAVPRDRPLSSIHAQTFPRASDGAASCFPHLTCLRADAQVRGAHEQGARGLHRQHVLLRHADSEAVGAMGQRLSCVARRRGS